MVVQTIYANEWQEIWHSHLKALPLQAEISKSYTFNYFNSKMTDGRNMLATTMFPKGVTLPTEEDVMNVVHRVRNMKDEEFADADGKKGKKLENLHVKDLDINPIPGTIVKTTVRNDSISEWLLSNGVKVLLWKKKTDKNSINMMFDRPMGFSALRDEVVGFQNMLSSCRRHFDFVGGFSSVQVKPYDDEIDVPMGLQVQDRKEHWKNIEQQLKMIHASLTTTEVDTVEAAEQIKNIQASIFALNNPIMQAQLRVQNLPAAHPSHEMHHCLYMRPQTARADNEGCHPTRSGYG